MKTRFELRWQGEGLPPWVFALMVLAVLMLGASVFYPMGYDQAVFSVGGEMILKAHAIPYRDFLDTKPPLIFCLYAAATAIFGEHDWSIRAFDLFFQLGTAIYFYRILRRYFERSFALTSASLALIVYEGLGFWHTAQAESFAILPSLVLVDVTLRMFSRPGKAFILGLCAGASIVVLLLLKFTLAFGGLAAAVFILVNRDLRMRDRWQYVLGMLLSLAALIVVLGIALSESRALHAFVLVTRWMVRYATISSFATGESFAEQLFLRFPLQLVYNFSLSLSILGALGVALYLKDQRLGKRNALLGLLLLTGIAQLIGVLIERKIVFPYQYVRALWAFTPLATLGLFRAIRFGGAFWKGITTGNRQPRMRGGLILAAVVLAALALSPLARIFTQSIPWSMLALRGEDVGREVHTRIRDYYADEQAATGTYLKSRMMSTDKLFFWGNDVAIYWYAGKLPPTICLTATPLRTEWTPKVWRETMMQQLSDVRPKYFVVEFGDAKDYITGSGDDSYEALVKWPELARYLSSHFRRDTVVGHYILFSSDGSVRSD